MSDLDLAVMPERLDEAVALMQELGYRRVFAPQARFTPRHGHDVAFAGGGPLPVEIHYRLFHELGADGDVEPLFARAISVELLGRARRVPAWDDHICLIAVHAATHAFGDSPLWVFDLALLGERGSFAEAEAEAARRQARFAFRSALRLAHRFVASVPAPAPSPSERMRERLLDALLGGERIAAAPTRIRSLLARALLTDDPRDAILEVGRKLELRLVELRERMRAS
jgi:hypothetical protein